MFCKIAKFNSTKDESRNHLPHCIAKPSLAFIRQVYILGSTATIIDLLMRIAQSINIACPSHADQIVTTYALSVSTAEIK